MAWRALRARPARMLLTLVGIALGVAAVLATNIANRSTSVLLDRLFARTLGNAELQISPSGKSATISKAVLEAVVREPGVRLAVPLLRARTVLPGTLGEGQMSYTSAGTAELGLSVEVVGIDPAIESLMRVYTLIEGSFPQPKEYAALVPRTFAAQNELATGSELALYGPEGIESVEVSGLLADEGAATTNGGNVVFLPLDTMREVFSLEPGYGEITVQTEEGIGDNPEALAELKARLEGRLGDAVRVTYPSARADQVPRMARTYQLALSFFSLIALIMGGFLIYNTFATSVVERTREIGVLRAIGMLPRQLIGQVLAEAGLLAGGGCLLGVGAGLGLARGLMALMRGFLRVETPAASLAVSELLQGLSVGLLGTLLAMLLPTLQATRTPPVEALSARGRAAQRLSPSVWRGGVGLLAAGGLLLYLPATGPAQVLIVVRLAAFALFLVGAVLTVPLAVTALEPISRWLSTRLYGAMGALGARNVQRSAARTMVTIASLAISLILIVLVDSMVSMMKQDVSDWLDRALGADLLVRAPYPMQVSFAQALESLPGVEAASPSRAIEVRVAADALGKDRERSDTLYYVAIDPAAFRRVGDKELVSGQGDPEAAWATLAAGNAVFVSSVVAEEYGLSQGSRLALLTRRGRQELVVAGVVIEFDQNGLIVTGTYDDLRRLYGETGADLYSVKVAAGVDAQAVAGEIRQRYEERRGIQVQEMTTVAQGIMTLYNQTSSLFNVLILVGVIIGSTGLLNTMTMSLLERTRELGMLRASGCQRSQLVRVVLAEALVIGIVSAVYGLGFGHALSHMMISVVNLITGYDLHYVFAPRPYLVSLAIALGVSQLATLAPAAEAARVHVIEALRHE